MMLTEAIMRYGAATDCLARVECTLRSRLKEAAKQILPLRRIDLPQEILWTEHEAIKYSLTKVEKGNRGKDVSRTVALMGDSEVQHAALKIVNMSSRIKQVHKHHEHQMQKRI